MRKRSEDFAERVGAVAQATQTPAQDEEPV